MPTELYKPRIFISYAHLDEPEEPAEGEIKWLSFVTGFLRPAVKHGAVDIWIDRMIPGGADWERDIATKLRACDIFVLLVSRHSTSSDYIVDKEMAIIRARQARAEDVHFSPLLLTPTPEIGLDLVRDKNLRPRDGKPFSDYSLNERYRHMNEAANEIARIARQIAERRMGPPAPEPPRAHPSPPSGPRRVAVPEIKDKESLAAWLKGQSREAAAATAARAALRVAPLAVRAAQNRSSSTTSQFASLTSAVLRAAALARFASKNGAAPNDPQAVAALGAAADAAGAAFGAGAAVARAATDAAGAAFAGDPAAAAFAAATAAAAAALGAAAANDIWQEVRADLIAFQTLEAGALADLPLWPRGAPEWARDAWVELHSALPNGEDWDVWIEWYEERLRGGSRGEAYEAVFAGVPLDVWHKSPAAANAWIKAHLPTDRHVSISPDLPRPLPDHDSPFTYGWNASARVIIVAGAQNLPFYSFFTSEEDHRHALETCRLGAERLLKTLREGGYNARPEYREALEYYLEDLPRAAGVGNILLANDQIRVLYAMFEADANMLPEGLAGRLKRVIENQFALNASYDIVERHNRAVSAADWTQPFPADAAKRFLETVRENTPSLFEPEVGEGIARVERSAPQIALAPDERRAPAAAIQPPLLPPGAPNEAHSRQRQIATAANALWGVFLKGKDLPVAIDGWTLAAQKLGENIGPILDFLRGPGAPS